MFAYAVADLPSIWLSGDASIKSFFGGRYHLPLSILYGRAKNEINNNALQGKAEAV